MMIRDSIRSNGYVRLDKELPYRFPCEDGTELIFYPYSEYESDPSKHKVFAIVALLEVPEASDGNDAHPYVRLMEYDLYARTDEESMQKDYEEITEMVSEISKYVVHQISILPNVTKLVHEIFRSTSQKSIDKNLSTISKLVKTNLVRMLPEKARNISRKWVSYAVMRILFSDRNIYFRRMYMNVI